MKYRYSRTARQRQLANSCQHCYALQGNFPVQEDALERVVSTDGPDGLDTLLVADYPVLEWQAVVHDVAGA
ncbi:hypothetical protein ACFV4E_29220 [Streptomyces hygroscopicus]|uniref:hypothetical protein n=1 Tax=Streptomyces hygroscopicus TaxID=1912 RepID=UPI00078398C4|nr:hypothetical protein [Streptomyces hygroscopicus]